MIRWQAIKFTSLIPSSTDCLLNIYRDFEDSMTQTRSAMAQNTLFALVYLLVRMNRVDCATSRRKFYTAFGDLDLLSLISSRLLLLLPLLTDLVRLLLRLYFEYEE